MEQGGTPENVRPPDDVIPDKCGSGLDAFELLGSAVAIAFHQIVGALLSQAAIIRARIALRGCLPDVSNVSAASLRAPRWPAPGLLCMGLFSRKRRPQHRQAGGDHDAVHQQAEDVRFETQHEALGDEGAEHQRRAGNEALDRDIGCQRAEARR